jgi:flagellar basal body-associated protein FliL
VNILIIAAITMPLLACEMLVYLSGIPELGPLVRMIVCITKGSFNFIVVLLIIICSFAGSFVLFFTHNNNNNNNNSTNDDGFQSVVNNYNRYDYTLMTVYGFLFGSYSVLDFDYSQSKSLGIFFILYMFLFFVVIIMLNLLIAIMGDKYNEVQRNDQAEAFDAKATIVLEYERQLLHSFADDIMNYNNNNNNNSNNSIKESSSSFFLWKWFHHWQQRRTNLLLREKYMKDCFPKWIQV